MQVEFDGRMGVWAGPVDAVGAEIGDVPAPEASAWSRKPDTWSAKCVRMTGPRR